VTAPDWDDPDTIDAWLDSQEEEVCAYLETRHIPILRETLEPGWTIPPVVSVWVADTQVPDPRSVWVIAGDLPTDYIPGAWAASDRDAIRVFSQRWLKQSELMAQGLNDSNAVEGSPE
jgi:hypothetical protein